MRLLNKVAVITGAASGIGKGIAECFASEGAKIVIADVNHTNARAVARTINDKGGNAIAVSVDVTNESQVSDAIAEAVSHFGGIDILVSNAGVALYISPVDEMPYAEWKRMLNIQLDGAFLTTKYCLQEMYKQGNGGTIIYTGSIHSKETTIQQFKSPYVTAKHGLLGLCRVVAKEGAQHGVRANIICPGFVNTPLLMAQVSSQAKAFGVSEDDLIKNVWLKDTVDGEFTTVNEIANVALFLASFESNALTGQSLFVTHGWSMQ